MSSRSLSVRALPPMGTEGYRTVMGQSCEGMCRWRMTIEHGVF